MQTTFDILDEEDIDVLSKSILARLVMGGEALTVEVSKFTEKKTNAQTKLYHMWMGEIGAHTGCSKEEMKIIYQDKFMMSIYVEHNICNFKEVARNMNAIKGSVPMSQYIAVRKTIVESMSHTKLNVKLMSEYLRSIQHHIQCDLGFRLSDPTMQGLL